MCVHIYLLLLLLMRLAAAAEAMEAKSMLPEVMTLVAILIMAEVSHGQTSLE